MRWLQAQKGGKYVFLCSTVALPRLRIQSIGTTTKLSENRRSLRRSLRRSVRRSAYRYVACPYRRDFETARNERFEPCTKERGGYLRHCSRSSAGAQVFGNATCAPK